LVPFEQSGGKPPFLTSNLHRGLVPFEQSGGKPPFLTSNLHRGLVPFEQSGGKPPFLTSNLRRKLQLAKLGSSPVDDTMLFNTVSASENAGAFVTVEGAGTFMKAATTSCKASLYSCLRACFARAAPIAVLTSLTSSGGGKTAFIPSPLIHNSRVHPVV